MGMFDKVLMRCPGCGFVNEEQTKAGPCILADYELHEAPLAVLGDVANTTWVCACGARLRVQVQAFAQVIRRP